MNSPLEMIYLCCHWKRTLLFFFFFNILLFFWAYVAFISLKHKKEILFHVTKLKWTLTSGVFSEAMFANNKLFIYVITDFRSLFQSVIYFHLNLREKSSFPYKISVLETLIIPYINHSQNLSSQRWNSLNSIHSIRHLWLKEANVWEPRKNLKTKLVTVLLV